MSVNGMAAYNNHKQPSKEMKKIWSEPNELRDSIWGKKKKKKKDDDDDFSNVILGYSSLI